MQDAGPILCPAAGCPESLLSSTKHFNTFTSIRNHLNAHCNGQLPGAIPADFLSQYSFTQCKVCNKILHVRYRGGICTRCKPSVRIRAQMNVMQNRTTSSNNYTNEQSSSAQGSEAGPLPSLLEVHEHFVPTIRNIPMSLKRLWAQCLSKTLSQVVWFNNEAAWTHLQMHPLPAYSCGQIS